MERSYVTPTLTLLGFKKSTQHPEMKEGCVMGSGVMTRREVRRQFWLLVRSGVMRRAAATALGFDPDTGRDWFRQAGGGITAFVTRLPRRSRDAGLARDDLSVDLRAGPGRLASRAGGLPAHRPGVTPAAPKPPGAPHPDSGYGQHQRAARGSGGPRRAGPLGRRPHPGQ